MAAPLRRVPRGYVGTDHQTIGSDILAISNALMMSEQVLGPTAALLATVKPDAWYPISLLLDALDLVEQKVGRASLQQVGRRLFQLSHAAIVKPTVKCAADLIFGIDGMYHHANRGTGVGGWAVQRFTAGHALIEKTTPHPCPLEEGILAEAFSVCGLPCFVSQKACLRDGADACLFEVSSVLRDERWHGGRPYVGG